MSDLGRIIPSPDALPEFLTNLGPHQETLDSLAQILCMALEAHGCDYGFDTLAALAWHAARVSNMPKAPPNADQLFIDIFNAARTYQIVDARMKILKRRVKNRA